MHTQSQTVSYSSYTILNSFLQFINNPKQFILTSWLDVTYTHLLMVIENSIVVKLKQYTVYAYSSSMHSVLS